jgi:hypothetical protein
MDLQTPPFAQNSEAKKKAAGIKAAHLAKVFR